MHQKSLQKLEYNRIKEIISSYCMTFKGKELALSIMPMSSKKEIEKALKQTTEASILLFRKGNTPFCEIEDIKIHIKKLNSNQFLNIKQLLDLANILNLSSSLKKYFSNEDDGIDLSEFTELKSLFENLYENKNVSTIISHSVIDENTLSDDASAELKSIRKNIRNKEQEIKNKLNSFLHSKYLQEPVITMRSGRYVIPVKNEYRQEIKGFIHDISSSGSTVFVEPVSVFDLNNDLNNFINDEHIEIEKILQKLSALFFDIIPNIENDINLIGILDFTFAKGKYSNSIEGTEPIINTDKIIDLYGAWHPLLDMKSAIRNDIIIGKNYTSLIITGPNTGGKTVMLKTVGIITLMALSGMHIPSTEGSTVYLTDNIFADIGDDQSISDSLSTFSSHMTNIAHIIKNATSQSLVLIDELGSGTDPIEGSSLAISILENLHSKNILTLSTTHYPEIKHYALITDGFENASVEFNIETLSPTYKLLLGVPGTSNAFAISSKLGISDEIISRAKSFLNNDEIKIETLLTNIYEDKKIIEKEKEKIKNNSEEIKKIKDSLNVDLTELKNQEAEIINNAKAKAKDILLNAKEDANEIINRLEETTSNKKANEERNTLNKKIKELSDTSSTASSNSLLFVSKESYTIADLKTGDDIFIPKINQYGKIASISKAGKIEVILPLGKSYFNFEDIEIPKYNKEKNTKDNKAKTVMPTNYKTKKEFIPKSIQSEINVIGMTVLEACDIIDKYLDTTSLSGLSQVRIVHGKGTGALRKGIHEFLKTHPHVKSYRVGTFGEGEMGVTIVELK